MREATSASVARKMKNKGYTKLYALKGGWTDWTAAKLPTEPKEQKK